ncbi:hypothetical protein [Rubeoparvulum massiliense]|uniref:hypothetical protein n=1 Tax=Rubeoparvulum massiliense TaxID=1631346 RepID=UPI00065E3C3F|nr:hypothetical protein [Rubeoparvulum massiliense]
MKKSGRYVIYNNKEYSATMDLDTNEVIVFTNDKKEKKNGFKKDWSTKGLYYKRVAIQDIDYAFYLSNCALYRGEKVVIFGSEDDCLWIAADSDAAKRAGIPRSDKFSYEVLVKNTEIGKCYEEKKPIWGFEKKDEPPNMD